MRSLADELADWIVSFSLAHSDHRERLVFEAKLHVLDGVGLALGALSIEDGFASKLRATVLEYGSGDATLIGWPDRVASPLAAFYNGSVIHGCEFDSTSYERTIHVEPFALPAVLALGERLGSSGPALAEAWCVATEIALRLAAGCDDTHGLLLSGFHSSSIFGTYGAAAGAAKLLALDQEATADALALCATTAGGTTAGWGEGSGRGKHVQPGWASLAGINAALLASNGYDCPHSTLDGPRGLFATHAWQGQWTRERVTDGLGEEWKLLEIAFKLHAASAMMQAVLECTQTLVTGNELVPAEVESVDVVMPAQYAQIIARTGAGEIRRDAIHVLTTQVPQAVACMILNRHVGIEHLRPSVLTAPELVAVAEKVSLRADEDASLPADEQWSSVTISTSRGSFAARYQGHPGRDPRVTLEQLLEKFHRNAALVLSEPEAAALAASIVQLEDSTAAEIARLARRDTTAAPA